MNSRGFLLPDGTERLVDFGDRNIIIIIIVMIVI